ncbi:MAG: metallophosphoesterase [Bacteroidales bacterium]|nr:metallophosphoesterase [Bacteroidales bacterium]
MKRFNYLTYFVGLSLLVFFALTSCINDTPATIDPFNNGTSERNLIVVLSDMHLGADLAYAECKDNLPSLEKLLKQIKASANVKELVIAGDLLDEWFVPAPIDTYQGKDQADFVQRIATTNKGVMDAFQSLIDDENILVTYVPGNHDLTITEASVEIILPGINQARDPELGLGTYSPAGYPEIAIEHGHRYNFFCAPDPFSNQDVAPGTISPPGYFFTRIAALHVLQGFPPAGDTLPVVTPNTSGDESQNLLYAYWKLWDWAINYLKIENSFDEKIIVTNVDGFTDTYAVNDLVPFQGTAGGLIDVHLYKGIQDTWNQRLAHNRVPVNIPVLQAIAGSDDAREMDNQAKVQYFLNPDSDVRIVVFGHTHVPKFEVSDNHRGQKAIYVNSGTWIDHNTLDSTAMNFVVITPQIPDASSQTHVRLYSFKNEIVVEMASDSLKL